MPWLGVPVLRGLVGTQGCECTSGCSSDAWLGLLVVCPSAEVLVVCACIPRCTGVCYAQACACTHVYHLRRRCMLFKCVCTNMHPPLQKVCCVHVCVHTRAPLCRRCMPFTRVCTHMHPPLQKLYVVHKCVCTRIPLYRGCMSCTHVYMHTHASYSQRVHFMHTCTHTRM